MSIYDPSKAHKENWASLVEKQSKGLTPDEFTWFTPEDIPMKVLYTAEDTAELPYTDTMPGMSPYIRGPQATLKFLSNATMGTNKTSGYFTIFEIGSGIPNLFIAKGSFVDHW